MRVTDTHVYFWGSCFSNFYKTKVTIEMPRIGLSDDGAYLDPKELKKYTFPTSEHVYMAFKAIAFKDVEAFSDLLDVEHPADAKRIGRRVKNFNQKLWDGISYDRMYKAVYAKFYQNEKIKELLLDTGTRTLVEGSPSDIIWGVGLYYDDDLILDESNWKGKNLLGKVLMDVRQVIWDCEDSEGWFEYYARKED